jgi:hypothetical protein
MRTLKFTAFIKNLVSAGSADSLACMNAQAFKMCLGKFELSFIQLFYVASRRCRLPACAPIEQFFYFIRSF